MTPSQLVTNRAEYLRGAIPLQVCHAWQLDRDGAMEFARALDLCTELFRHTVFFEGDTIPGANGFDCPEWEALKGAMAERYRVRGNEDRSEALEQECLALMWPFVEPAIARDAAPVEWDFHCWRFTMSRDGRRIDLHFTNADRPRSPFDDMRRLADDMRRCIEAATETNPKAQTVGFTTWLNNLRKIQALFPAGWFGTRTNIKDRGGRGPGRWGQYLRADGGFNEKTALQLRATGCHPFPSCHCEAIPRDVSEHISRSLT